MGRGWALLKGVSPERFAEIARKQQEEREAKAAAEAAAAGLLAASPETQRSAPAASAPADSHGGKKDAIKGMALPLGRTRKPWDPTSPTVTPMSSHRASATLGTAVNSVRLARMHTRRAVRPSSCGSTEHEGDIISYAVRASGPKRAASAACSFSRAFEHGRRFTWPRAAGREHRVAAASSWGRGAAERGVWRGAEGRRSACACGAPRPSRGRWRAA